MTTLLAPKKNQTWDSSVIHLSYYVLCFQCSASDYLLYKVIILFSWRAIAEDMQYNEILYPRYIQDFFEEKIVKTCFHHSAVLLTL